MRLLEALSFVSLMRQDQGEELFSYRRLNSNRLDSIQYFQYFLQAAIIYLDIWGFTGTFLNLREHFMPKAKKDNDHNAMVSGKIKEGVQIRGRLWLESKGQTYLSWGRIVLLERIDEHGSVSAAAKSMKMSFSHAWKLVEDMNTLAPEPLVEKQAGGRQGGGAWLTDSGKQAVKDFWHLVKKFQDWIDHEHC